MKPEQLACVSALVGAGGNAGAVFAGFAFYKQDWDDTLTPFKLHALYVIVTALMNPAYYWPHLGGMFRDPVVDPSAKAATEESKADGETTKSTANSETAAEPSARV